MYIHICVYDPLLFMELRRWEKRKYYIHSYSVAIRIYTDIYECINTLGPVTVTHTERYSFTLSEGLPGSTPARTLNRFGTQHE